MTAAVSPCATDLRARLRDPTYFALHLQAAMAIRKVGSLGWYDSYFLRRVEIAKLFLAQVRPDALAAFADGFAPLTPPATFRETLIDDVFDEATCAQIIATSRSVRPEPSKHLADEKAAFGRDVLWNIPFFLDLQEQVRSRVEEIVGQPLVASYNFLSLYGAEGKCALHMDHPDAMYTFDYCIEQDAPWAIYVARPAAWPTAGDAGRYDPERIKADPAMGFAEYRLRPNQAVVFNGSSQWHYRNPKTAGGYCNLLFFHYYPAGCESLVATALWPDHFAIPELEPLCDLFEALSAEGHY